MNQWGTAEAAVITAGGRPNPTVSVTPEYNFNAAQGASPWLPTVAVDWPLETARKREHRIDAARYRADAARLGVITTAWLTRHQVLAATLAVQANSARIDVLSGQVRLLDEWVERMDQRVSAGALARQEANGIRIHQQKARVELASAVSMRRQELTKLASTLALPIAALDGIQFTPLPPALPVSVTTARKHEALLHRSEVLAALSEYAAAEAGLRLELAKQYPDIHLGTGYQWDQSESKWSLGMTAEIPVLNRNQGPIAEALARRAEAATRFDLTQSRALQEIDQAIDSQESALRQQGAQNHLIQTLNQRLAALEAEARFGSGDPVDRLAIQLELGAAALTDLDIRVAILNAALGIETSLQWVSDPGRPFDPSHQLGFHPSPPSSASSRPSSTRTRP